MRVSLCPIRILRSVLLSCYQEMGVESVVLIAEDFRFDFTIDESLDENGLLFWFVHAGEQVHRETGFPVPYPFDLHQDQSGATALGWRVASRRVEPVAVTLGIWCVFDALMSSFENDQCQVVDSVLLIRDDWSQEESELNGF